MAREDGPRGGGGWGVGGCAQRPSRRRRRRASTLLQTASNGGETARARGVQRAVGPQPHRDRPPTRIPRLNPRPRHGRNGPRETGLVQVLARLSKICPLTPAGRRRPLPPADRHRPLPPAGRRRRPWRAAEKRRLSCRHPANEGRQKSRFTSRAAPRGGPRTGPRSRAGRPAQVTLGA